MTSLKSLYHLGLFLIACPVPTATILPSTIPTVMKTPTKVPTASLLSSGALDGDLTAH